MIAAGAEAGPAVFGALADPTRWRVLTLLAEHGEQTATGIAAEMPVSRPAVIKHLRILAGAGVIARRRAGREVRFRVEPSVLHQTSRVMSELACAWDARLATLKALAESPDPS